MALQRVYNQMNKEHKAIQENVRSTSETGMKKIYYKIIILVLTFINRNFFLKES